MIEVRENRFGKCVYATERIEKGTVILSGWGYTIPARTQHSFQVDVDKHIVIEGPIQLINHSCDPNCGVYLRQGIDALEIHARRDIEASEELYTDYATFEYEIKHFPGRCLCGNSNCRGAITGYKDLSNAVRDSYGQYIAEYLEEMEAGALATR
ncbi:MAG TPA: SET domain-containing protein-lysine N-methyltransferase [Pirellulales bacterium]|jgi:hypothetical protein|nr:SET domain-containing protein-lysine N-methyltransferase [Pirellulales bacterium]